LRKNYFVNIVLFVGAQLNAEFDPVANITQLGSGKASAVSH